MKDTSETIPSITGLSKSPINRAIGDMAQFLTLLSIIFLFAAYNPIVCAISRMFSGRRNYASYVNSSECSLQYLGPIEKATAYDDEESASQVHNLITNSQQEAINSLVGRTIRSAHRQSFGAGLYLFQDNHTASFPHVNSAPTNNDLMSDCLEAGSTTNPPVYCNHLKNYPNTNHLGKLIKLNLPQPQLVFGQDLIVPNNITQRANIAPNGGSLCKIRSRIIFPQSGVNKNYDWLYIVNLPEYRQGIRIEECLEPGAVCGKDVGLTLPNHYTATCEQSYVYRALIAYDDNKIVRDTFKIPSCCKCVLSIN